MEALSPAFAQLNARSRIFFDCPGCGKTDAFEVTHFLPDRADHPFGPWQCKGCDADVRGHWVAAVRGVRIESVLPGPRTIPLFLLLRVRGTPDSDPVWIVVNYDTRDHDGEMRSKMGMESLRESLLFLIEEHQCPTNYVRVEAVIAKNRGGGIDSDPHGIFELVAVARRDVPFLKDVNDDPEWMTIFPDALGSVIINGRAEAPAIMLGAPS